MHTYNKEFTYSVPIYHADANLSMTRRCRILFIGNFAKFNLFIPGYVIWPLSTWSTLIQIMACCLFQAKPLPINFDLQSNGPFRTINQTQLNKMQLKVCC